MKQFWKVLSFEIGNYFKNKSFITTTRVILFITIALVAVPTFIPGLLDKGEKGSKQEVEVYGICMLSDESEEIFRLFPEAAMDGEWQVYDTAKSLRNAVESGETECGFVLNSSTDYTYVVQNNSMYDNNQSKFQDLLKQVYEKNYMLSKGISPEEVDSLQQTEITSDMEILGKNSARNYGYTYILIFSLYFLILFYGQMIATAVTTEKSNRAIEILVTSVNTNSLIFGKVIAGAVAGATQMVVILGGAFGTYSVFREEWGNALDFLFHVPGQVWAVYIVFGLVGYLLYSFVFGVFGALVSKTEDISKNATGITLITVASFLIAIFGMQNSDSLMLKVASYVPFTSSNAMLVRVAMGTVGTWEIIVSFLLLLVTCILVGILAGRLFRLGTLMYGNPVKLSSALKKLRQS